MPKPARTTLILLIEAGQRAHRALLRPLVERGLEAGDDAILLLLGEGAVTDADLEDATGIGFDQLGPRLERLVTRELIVRTATGFALTERGARLRERLAEVWAETEAALTGGLRKKKRRALAKLLLAFAEYLDRRGGA